MTSVKFKQLDKWLADNRYKYLDLANALNISGSAVARWKMRGQIPLKHRSLIFKIMHGKKKLTSLRRTN